MNSGCKRVKQNLIDFVERELPDVLKGEIEEHLRSCAKCDRIVREFSLIWQDVSARERRSPSASFWPDLVERIQSDENPRQVWEQIILGFKRSLRPVAVTLLLLGGAFFGYQVGYIPKDTGKTFSGEEYFVEYLETFQDFPLGSAGDFYFQYSTTQQGEIP